MSVVKPTIDELLSVTDENRFLLCEIAARRACDINDMMRNQHNRAEQLADIDDVSQFLSDEEGRTPNPLSIAFDEIAPKHDDDGTVEGPGPLSFDEATLNHELGLVDEQITAQDEMIDETVSQQEEAQEQTAAESESAEQTASETSIPEASAETLADTESAAE